MIYVIIGQSGAGKTTYIKRRFLSGVAEPKTCEDVVHYVVCGSVALIGKYNIGIRTEGTDTLPYNAGARIIDQALKLAELGLDVVVDGDRINNRRLLTRLAMSRFPLKLILFRCSVATSLRRLRAAGSNTSAAFVRSTRTKSRNNFLEFASQMSGEVVDTDEA